MSHVIYNKQTYRRFKTPQGNESFATERAAKGVLTKMVNGGVLKRDEWVVASYGEWRDAEPMVETYNLMDPERKPIPIRASEKGGCTDPATERYHTM